MYEENPEDITAILNYTSSLLAKGSITRQEEKYGKMAEEILKKAIEKYPNNSELYRNLGYSYEIREKYDEAFKVYDKSIELNPNNALAYANRGHAYRLYGDYTKAEKDFLKAYELNPKNDYILINLAWVYNIKHDYDNALKYYKESIKNLNNNRFKSEVYHSMGQIYLGKRELDKAEESFQNAIKEDPKFELGYLGMSKLKMERILSGNKDKKEEKELLIEALENNEVAIALNPTRAESYFNKGLILREIDRDQSNFLLNLALDAIDVDLTLGKQEKEYLRNYINSLLKDNEKYRKN